MNRVYRIVFNGHLGIPQVASELACGGTAACAGAQASSRRTGYAARAIAVAVALAMAGGTPAWAATVTGAAGGAGSNGTSRNVPVGNWGIGGDGGSAAPQAGAAPAAAGGTGGNGGDASNGGYGVAGNAGSYGSGGGGGGGSFARDNAGGAGGAAYQGWAAGGAGGSGAAGGGGGGGGGGYAGSYLGTAPAALFAIADLYVGGAGGAGGSADNSNSGASGGNGGTGGSGMTGDSYHLTVLPGAGATGGRGGDGGSHGNWGGSGGVGGSGGLGVGGTGFTLDNRGTLTGGNGGTGGSGNVGGSGGAGLGGTGFNATNTGTIVGGNGGNGASGGVGVAAFGGATVTNAGTIAGGLADNGAGAPADAVHFSGGGNTLVLVSGSTLVGNALSNGGDTLALGGDTDGSFDLASVVAAPSGTATGTQYVGFSTLRKTGSSTWTVTGANSVGAGWLLDSGVLAIASTNGAELGPSVTFNGGALDFNNTSAAAYGGNLVVGANGGTINANGNQLNYLNNQVTFTGSLSGGALALNADPASARGLIVLNGAAGTQRVDSLTATHGIVRLGDWSTTTDLAVGDLILEGSAALNVTSHAALQVSGGIAIASTASFSLDGELDVASSASIGTAVAMNRSAILSVGAGQVLDLRQGFYGEGLLNITGGGTVLDSGTSSGLAGIAIAGGSVFQVGSGGTSDAIRLFGGMRNDGTLVWNHADQASAAWDIQGAGALVHNGTGTLTLGGFNTYTGGTLVNGGTVVVSDTGNLGTGALTIAGGAAVSLGNATQDLASINGAGTLTLGGTTLGVTGGGADLFAGSLAGNGMLTYSGGTLTLDGDSRGFAGTTTMAGGELVVGSVAGNGAVLGGNVTMEGGTTLRGHGEIGGNVDVLGGAHLAPGHSIGTLTIDGDLHLAQGSVLDDEFGAPGADMRTAGIGDSVHVGGNLSLDGATLNVTDLGMGPGVYNVFTYGGTLSETNGGIAFGSTPAGHTLLWQNLAAQKQINLVDATGLTLNFWNANALASATRMGGGSGTWSATAPQWTDALGATANASMLPRPGFAIFGGTAGTVTVDGSAGAVQATGMQFATDGYAVQGDALELVGGIGSAPIIRVGDGSSAGAGMTATIGAVLSGSAGLTKTDAGTLVLSGNNTYAGGTAIEGGTLAVSSDANLGTATGALTFNGGTLRNTAAFATARSMNLAGNGTLQTDADLVASGAIGGSGVLTKTGSGMLTLSGDNAYAGGTVIDGGTVSVAGDANLGAAGGGLTFTGGALRNTAAFATARSMNLAGNGTLQTDADLTVSGAITGTGGLSKTGNGTLTLAGANAYSGGTTVGAGTLQGDTHSLQGDVTDNATLVFAQGDRGVFNGTLRGNGRLRLQGPGALVLNGANPFAGDTTVSAGTLVVGDDSHAGAMLGGKVTVAAGGTLHGIGTVGGLDLGGTVAPGNSIGTLRVAGDAVFEEGSAYQLEVQPDGASDRVAVGGKATIQGGTVTVLAAAGSYAPSTDYTVLTAGQGISGRFDGVSSSLAFLTPTLSYAANVVTLTMQRNDIAMASIAVTPNQRAVASGIESLGRGQAVYDAILGMDAAHARASYDPLTGELHASTRTALLDDSFYVRDALNRRLLGLDGAGDRAASRGDVTAWTSAWGRAAQIDGDGNASRLTADSSGLLVGADVAVGEQGKLGAFAGTGKQSLRIAARGDDADVHATHLGLYGGMHWGAWQARAGVAYAWQRVDSKRLPGPAGSTANAAARYDAGLAHGYVEGGYRFEFGQVALEPYLNAAHMRLRTDAIGETGSAAALDVAGRTTDTTTATFGARVYVGLDAQGAVHAHAGLGWRQAWGATASSVRERFAAGGSSFTVEGLPIARHAATVEGGLSWRWSPRVSMDASYQGQFADRNKDQAVRLGLNVAL